MVKHFFPFRFRIICDTKEVFIVFAKGRCNSFGAYLYEKNGYL